MSQTSQQHEISSSEEQSYSCSQATSEQSIPCGQFISSQASEASRGYESTVCDLERTHDSVTINSWSYESFDLPDYSQGNESSIPRSSTEQSIGYNFDSSIYTDEATNSQK